MRQSYKVAGVLYGSVSVVAMQLGMLNFPQFVATCTEFLVPNELVENRGPFQELMQCIPMENDIGLSMITSALFSGGAVGCLISDYCNFYHVFPLRWEFLGALALEGLSLLGLVYSESIHGVAMWRFVGGLGCGVVLGIVPTYVDLLTELKLMPKQVANLGYMVSLALGVAVCQVVSWPVIDSFNWRWIFVYHLILVVGNMLAVLTMLVESPKWYLIMRDKAGTKESLRQYLEGTQEEHDISRVIDKWGQELDDIVRLHLESTASNTVYERIRYWILYVYRNLADVGPLTTKMVLVQCFNFNFMDLYGIKVIKEIMPDSTFPVNVALSCLNVALPFASVYLWEEVRSQVDWRAGHIFVYLSITAAYFFVFLSFHYHSKLAFMVSMVFLSVTTHTLMTSEPLINLAEGSDDPMVHHQQIPMKRYSRLCYWVGGAILAYCFPLVFDLIGHRAMFLIGLLPCISLLIVLT
ncbi:uncharacterized protein KNAG_0F02300 [Huiozyma naganishii CBS 8797]|uniref:Major facilitator superfamily (MFS) profile domain-containing protein n=1 Tax=Huiozyma naganishii (strain ATCC MYA-139 / BCRC 22969 / CBS 8797 / KCTC 17520 / NBRC 10181 / NCYC 3082 / Yp74L-3) TaxID=1071383 RepID=J7R7P5_HUIN7|nr:hypothetical protein KNAG_0F02300 [Kazachstania naganishii CBS 8797]CCK70895.1 hypothetical protein KNAG_0F02300 [Kazachstania naganishii CBS 8797]